MTNSGRILGGSQRIPGWISGKYDGDSYEDSWDCLGFLMQLVRLNSSVIQLGFLGFSWDFLGIILDFLWQCFESILVGSLADSQRILVQLLPMMRFDYC